MKGFEHVKGHAGSDAGNCGVCSEQVLLAIGTSWFPCVRICLTTWPKWGVTLIKHVYMKHIYIYYIVQHIYIYYIILYYIILYITWIKPCFFECGAN